jgi:hypothetical protein
MKKVNPNVFLAVMVFVSFLFVFFYASVKVSTGDVISPNPNVCGNGIREGTEKCDGTALGGANCSTVLGPRYTGTLKCSSSCIFDTRLCVASRCGNAVCESIETCATCQADCGCSSGKTCRGGQCVTPSRFFTWLKNLF